MKSVRSILAMTLACLLHVTTTRAQNFTSPQQSGIAVGGTSQRQGVSGALVNNTLYVAYTGTDGYLYLTSDPNNTLSFSSPARISTPQGAVNSPANPAMTSLNGVLYLTYISGSYAPFIIYSTNAGGSWSSPAAIAPPGGVKIDGEPSMSAFSNTLYVGLHNGTSQSIIVCSLTLSFAQNCLQTGQGSTYGPGLAYFRGGLSAGVQSNDSNHTLIYMSFALDGNGQLTGGYSATGNTGQVDQTSAQPAIFAEDPNGTLLLGFRSNDGSAQFLTKSYHAYAGQATYWSGTYGNGYGMTGSPNLVTPPSTQPASPQFKIDINLFVQSGRLTSSYSANSH